MAATGKSDLEPVVAVINTVAPLWYDSDRVRVVAHLEEGTVVVVVDPLPIGNATLLHVLVDDPEEDVFDGYILKDSLDFVE